MSAKPRNRNWNDVQTAIATVAIVTTLGMWDLFATPAKAETVQTQEPVVPPTEPPVTSEPTSMPRVKIMFTPQAIAVVQQPQQEVKKKKKKKDNNNASNAGGGSVTQTQSS
jgi:hypothetical protein